MKKIEFLKNLDKHKHKRKIQESGCGCRVRAHFDLWQGQVIPNVYLQGLSTGKVLTKWVNMVLESADYIASSKDTQKGDVN